MSPPSRLSCREVFARLADYVDRELTADETAEVATHLEKCAHCASEYRFEEEVLACLKAKLRRIDLPADLQQRVRDLITREQARGGTSGP